MRGVVDHNKLVYNTDYVNKILTLREVKQESLESELEEKIKMLYQDSPYHGRKELKKTTPGNQF